MKARELMKNAIDETADVMIYILALSQQNNIDVSDSIKKKMEKNIKNIRLWKFLSRVKMQII